MRTATGDQLSTQTYLDLEEKYSAHNYHPLPVVLQRGEGVFFYGMWKVSDITIF